jgi:hypothetical protein
MATLKTQGNVPYPDGVEPVAGGDNAMAAMAAAIDTGWKTLTLSTGWVGVAGHVAPRVRNGRGRLELDGFAYWSGDNPATGSALTAANAAVKEVADAQGGAVTYLQAALLFMQNVGVKPAVGSLRVLPDGRLGVYPPGAAIITSAVISLAGISFASPCRVAP